YGALRGDPRHALGATAADGATTSDVTRMAHHFGGIAAFSAQSGKHLVKVGAQTDFLYGTSRFTAYERDDAAGGGIANRASGRDRTQALLSGAYAQDHITFDDVALDVGLRFDELHVILEDGSTNDSIGVSPRLGASNQFTKDIVGHAFAGVMWIPPAPLDAANAARALGVVPADQDVHYDLEPETDLYGETGLN